ncbi:4'-phosphopantetheinyl transferase family protein, partial [Campylobacter concisus]|uniref:4'-phosphopantetheinyl transferase family protein n=1 Tax=Campylobacter concisus TaxID=199 RepID=UPI000CD87386
GEIYLFIGFEAEKFSPKMLSKKDRRRLRKYPNLANLNSFKFSRYLKFKAKKRGKICLSHKENIAVLAISKEKVGVDVEELKERNLDGVIKFCFSKKESEIYENSKDKMQKFYEIYTAKEAVTKAKNLAFSDLASAKFDEMKRKYFIINNLFIICLAFKHCKDIIVKFL